MKGAALACLVAALLWFAPGTLAGTLVNKDPRAYEFIVHWEDLSPAEHGQVEAKAQAGFSNGTGILELTGTRDNIYVKAGDEVVIVNGVMNKKPVEKK